MWIGHENHVWIFVGLQLEGSHVGDLLYWSHRAKGCYFETKYHSYQLASVSYFIYALTMTVIITRKIVRLQLTCHRLSWSAQATIIQY